MRVCPHRIGEEVEFNDSTDPNTLWAATTWTQITDERVTLAAGTSHVLGDTGGSETHTLIADEMPNHRHQVQRYLASEVGYVPANGMAASVAVRTNANGIQNTGGTFTDRNSGTYRDTALIGYTGGSQAHNNMQPWRAVNRWRRTA